MVAPGTLLLSITRGIQFEERILQCKDANVAVTSDQSGVTGTYVTSGQFGGYDLFILSGAPGWFLYFNAAAATYVIAQTLTTAALTNYFLSTALTDPNGNYTGQGTYTGKSATATDNPTDLTGLAAEALVRRSTDPKSETVLDLQPVVTNAVAGEITIPAISKTVTETFRLGNFHWDLVLRDTTTQERFGPFVQGPFPISDNITSTLAP